MKASQQAEETHKLAEDKDSKLNLLKVKFQKLEELNTGLESRVKLQHEELEAYASKKQQEMEKWKKDRDQLVGQLQKILQEKDAKLNALSNHSGGSEKLEADLARMKQELSDKDETIAQLSAHLEDGNTTRA